MDANDLPDGLVLRSVGENALVFLESERGAFSGAEAAEIHSVIMLLRRILYAYAEEDTTQ